RGMGWDEGMFLEAYEANREEAATTALDSSILTDPLRAFLQEKGLPWQGTSTALLDGLNHHAPEHTRKKKGWPKSARHLSGMLRRLATVLRANGMHFEFFREDGGDRHRLVRIERQRDKSREPASRSSQPSQKQENPSCERDGRDDGHGAASL